MSLITSYKVSVRAKNGEMQLVNDGKMLSVSASERPLAMVLFSMTTTLHIPGKESFVHTALDSFLFYHLDRNATVKRWLLINELTRSNPRKQLKHCSAYNNDTLL